MWKARNKRGCRVGWFAPGSIASRLWLTRVSLRTGFWRALPIWAKDVLSSALTAPRGISSLGVLLQLRRVLPFAVFLLPLQLPAQTVVDTSTPAPNLIIRGVRLEQRDIFDPDESSWFARLANSLHIQTQPAVVRRELLFAVGQPYDSALVAESERNLRAIGVFRRVQIDSVRTPDGLMLHVITRDGWSTQADWRFRSTGGEIAFTIGLVESNLLGTASAAAIRYQKDPDRSTVAMSFRRPRLFAGSVGLGVG